MKNEKMDSRLQEMYDKVLDSQKQFETMVDYDERTQADFEKELISTLAESFIDFTKLIGADEYIPSFIEECFFKALKEYVVYTGIQTYDDYALSIHSINYLAHIYIALKNQEDLNLDVSDYSLAHISANLSYTICIMNEFNETDSCVLTFCGEFFKRLQDFELTKDIDVVIVTEMTKLMGDCINYISFNEFFDVEEEVHELKYCMITKEQRREEKWKSFKLK